MQPPPTPRSSAGRQVLIVIAVVLALLELLCAGVISFLINQTSTGALGAVASRLTTIPFGVANDPAPSASYRRISQNLLTTEGRQTL